MGIAGRRIPLTTKSWMAMSINLKAAVLGASHQTRPTSYLLRQRHGVAVNCLNIDHNECS